MPKKSFKREKTVSKIQNFLRKTPRRKIFTDEPTPKIFRRVRIIRFGIDYPSLDKSRKLLEEWPHAVDVHLNHNAGLHDAFQLLLEVAVHPG